MTIFDVIFLSTFFGLGLNFISRSSRYSDRDSLIIGILCLLSVPWIVAEILMRNGYVFNGPEFKAIVHITGTVIITIMIVKLIWLAIHE